MFLLRTVQAKIIISKAWAGRLQDSTHYRAPACLAQEQQQLALVTIQVR
jgi:hypothetical protein